MVESSNERIIGMEAGDIPSAADVDLVILQLDLRDQLHTCSLQSATWNVPVVLVNVQKRKVPDYANMPIKMARRAGA